MRNLNNIDEIIDEVKNLFKDQNDSSICSLYDGVVNKIE